MRLLLFIFGILLGLGILGGLYFYSSRSEGIVISPFGDSEPEKIEDKKLQKYSFESLRNRQYSVSSIHLDRPLSEDEDVITQVFSYQSDGKKVSGVLNIPKKAGTYPILVMLRGFVERDIYSPGIGTNRGAEFFSHNGFITLSPDFLGYGESDIDSFDSIEARFETYTTVLNLFASLDSLNTSISASYSGILADQDKIGLWAHSNGGHIALSTLAISGKKYPTSLWAPVSKPFPYSILYFTDEFDDEGKALRKVVSDFEKNYDVFDFSPPRYYSWIEAPLQIHQGTIDDAVPIAWSDDLYARLKDLDKTVEYYTYPGADHNLSGAAWGTAMSRSLEFYKDNFSSGQ